jgi:two-component system sensor histidine kinase UhpB
MRLRTRLNLVVTGLSTIFVIVLIGAEIQSSRGSVREEIEAANRVAAQLLGRLTIVYSEAADRDGLLQFLQQLGRVRANEISLVDDKGNELYRSPAATYKAGREAPAWFAELLAPLPVRQTFALRDGLILTIDAQPSRSILDAWDDITRLLTIAAIMLAVVSALAFGSVARALKPFPIIALGLKRIQEGDLTYRLPVLAGFEAGTIGAAFNRMAEAVQAKVLAEQKVHEAEVRLEERREMAYLTDQRVEEERRIIAHELHDELGQSVTAIRSLALAISARTEAPDPRTAEIAKLISEEAARLYDAMHGLIPRLTPLSLDSIGLTATLENLVRDWQSRSPATTLTLEHQIAQDLGPGVSLVVYRVIQEGLINALRHAQASAIAIAVHCSEQKILATVKDDGVGISGAWDRPGHFGLRGLQDRVRQLAGTFVIDSPPGRGVRLTAEIPLQAMS